MTFDKKEKELIDDLSKSGEIEVISKFLHDIAEYLYTGESDYLVDSIVSIKGLRDKVKGDTERSKTEKSKNVGAALSIHFRALAYSSPPDCDKKWHEEDNRFCICMYP